MKPRRVHKELRARGYRLVRSTKHKIYRHPETGDTVSVPHNNTDRDWRDDRRFRSLVRRLDRGDGARKGA